MELQHVLRTTPATRAFTEDDLPDDLLFEILDDARFAPNGGNRQAWRVIVVRDPETKRRISELYELGQREYAAYSRAGLVPFAAVDALGPPRIDLAAARLLPAGTDVAYLAAAPVQLVVLLDLVNCSAVDSGLDRLPLAAGASAYPFVHNILLAARDRGYGGHVTSLLAREEPALRELLHIPPHMALVTMLPLGRPQREITKLRRAPVESFTTVATFDGPPFAG
jgi:nitroreductase